MILIFRVYKSYGNFKEIGLELEQRDLKKEFEKAEKVMNNGYNFKMSKEDQEKLDQEVNVFKQRYFQEKMDRSANPKHDEESRKEFEETVQKVHAIGLKLKERFMESIKDPKDQTRFLDLLRFIGVSTPFCKIEYQKVAELWVNKYNIGRKSNNWISHKCKSIFNRKAKKWLCIGYNNIWYYDNPESQPNEMRDCLMIDTSTKLKADLRSIIHGRLKLQFIMSRRTLTLSINDLSTALVTMKAVVKAFTRSHYSSLHRFGSFAPPRTHSDFDLYVDGEDYFKEVRERILNAKYEIMICGWFISPEFPLIRPRDGSTSFAEDPNRLDHLLKQAASRGVRVYILVYSEIANQMYNDSAHCKEAFKRINDKNIKVLRHPTSIIQSVLWSHHEKMVIVDRKVAMIGGLDLAWGRWDTQSHDLFDYYGDGVNFPGIDYYNPFKKEILKGRKFETRLIESTYPRMPWHDVAIKLKGQVVQDYLTHFVSYWNHSRDLNNEDEVLFNQMSLKNPKYYISNSIKNLLKSKVKVSGSDQEISIIEALLIKKKNQEGASPKTIQIANPIMKQDNNEQKEEDDDSEIFGEVDVFESDHEDHENYHSKQVYGQTEFGILDVKYQEDYTITPEEVPETIPINEVRCHFKEGRFPLGGEKLKHSKSNNEQLINGLRRENIKLADDKYKKDNEEDNYDMGVDDKKVAEEGEIKLDFKNETRMVLGKKKSSISKGNQTSKFNLSAQALRSAGLWSIGLNIKETSIMNCYIDTILNAKRFIYIENQFFISSTDSDASVDAKIRNRIVKAIYQRIKQAIDCRETFRVIVFMPLMPAFEADLVNKQGEIMQIQIGLENNTIGIGPNSLISRIRQITDKPEKYLMVCGLRKYQYPPSNIKKENEIRYPERTDLDPVTELIYIHSKVV